MVARERIGARAIRARQQGAGLAPARLARESAMLARRRTYVLIRSREDFRAGFVPIARHIVLCDGDGATRSDLRLFTYRNRGKPLYPVDADFKPERHA